MESEIFGCFRRVCEAISNFDAVGSRDSAFPVVKTTEIQRERDGGARSIPAISMTLPNRFFEGSAELAVVGQRVWWILPRSS